MFSTFAGRLILAHELLHYLFRLENYENGIKADKFVDQAFLKTLKGKITCPNTILLFGDTEGADPKAYDELVAIVGHRYNINGNFVFLGESLFLQEYLGTKNCFLSYGHASNIKDELLTLENIHEIINLEEVAGEIAIEDAAQDDIVKICIEEQYEFIKTVGIVENKLDDEGKSKSLPDDNITPLRIGTPSHLLKNQNIIDAELSEAGYHIQNVPGDGNCAFTSVEVARGNEAFTGDNQLVRKLSQQQKEQIPALRNATAELMSKNQNDTISIKVINNLRQLGFWDSGIEGGVGIEVLSFVAQVIRQPILVLTQEPDGH